MMMVVMVMVTMVHHMVVMMMVMMNHWRGRGLGGVVGESRRHAKADRERSRGENDLLHCLRIPLISSEARIAGESA